MWNSASEAEKFDHTLHVFLLQILSSVLDGDICILNKRGELLKELLIPALSETKVYKNHFNANVKHFGTKKGKAIVIYWVRGLATAALLKKYPKVMESLKSSRVHISNHYWQEDEWDLKTLGFFTNVPPSTMST